MDDEKELWEGVTQELMSDKENVDDTSELKVKTPEWRTSELTNLVRKLDERKSEKARSNVQTPLRKQRIAADTPMKRKPSGRVIEIHSFFRVSLPLKFKF